MRFKSPWLFCLPAVIVLSLTAGWPLVRTIFFAFTNASLDNLENYDLIGFENFAGLFADPDWWSAVQNTLIFTGLSVTLETSLGLIVALALNRSFRGRGLLRAAVLIPWAIPTVVSAKMWAWMFHDLYGVINEILISAGLITERVAWLADPNLAMAAIVAVDVWKTTPFMALLILAALQGVPRNVLEAAKLDGIPPWQVFRSIVFPFIKPALTVAVIFRMLDAMRIFDLVFVLIGSGKTTAVMSTFARQQLVDFQDVGYGSAASTLIFLIIGIFTAGYLHLSRNRMQRAT